PTPPFSHVFLYGHSEMVSEEVIAYEAGYRYSQNNNFSVDLALFYNDYEKLLDFKLVDPTTILFTNDMEGRSYGLEISSQWRPLSWLTAELTYSYIELIMDLLDKENTSFSLSDQIAEESSPQHQLSLRSSIDLSETIRLNIWCRYIDKLNISSQSAYYARIQIEEYVALDINIIWNPTQNLELMLAGQNLLDPDHLEFISEYFVPATEIGQSVYAKLTWKF
ncbi:MAG: TonB-dependent receptor, partial [Proteobacteria bacterium]|nr:TonB-dependent receptor [Pseudomonadota bacterium]